MTREPISSTALVTVGYDPATQTLECEFKSGDVWQYTPVAADVIVRMRDMNHSAGRIFFAEVKSNPNVVATKIEPVDVVSPDVVPLGFPT